MLSNETNVISTTCQPMGEWGIYLLKVKNILRVLESCSSKNESPHLYEGS